MPGRRTASLILALLVGCTTELPSEKKDAPTSGSPGSVPTTRPETVPPASGEPEAPAFKVPEVPIRFARPHVNPPSLFQPAPPNSPPSVSRNEVLVRVLPANPGTLNPIFFTSMYEIWMEELLFDGLFIFDRDMQWKVNETMVEEFEDSEDHLVSRVKLKPGLKWHDGTPFTAHDVRFTWEAILDERVPVTALRNGTDQIEDVKVIDDLNLEFHHKEALPTNTWNMLFSIIPKHIYDNKVERAADPTLKQSDFFNRFNRAELVGNGPYKLVEWVTDDRIVIDRWDGFHGVKPAFKRIILKIQKDRNTALQLFKKGEVDEVELTQLQFARQTDDAAFKKQGYKIFAPEWSYSYIGWNMDGSNPFFAEAKVRRALSHALNYEKIKTQVLYDLVTRCHGIFSPESWMGGEEDLIQYDLAKAEKLLDEAGWKRGTDGWRVKTIRGKPVRFEYEMLIPKESQNSPKIAAIFAQDLTKIGVRMKQRVIDFVTFLDLVKKHDYQSSIAAWGTGTDPDTNRNIWHSSMYKSGRNYGGYKNQRVDALFELGRRELDRKKRAAYYREIQKIIYRDQPAIFLFNRSTTWAVHKRIRGIQWSPPEPLRLRSVLPVLVGPQERQPQEVTLPRCGSTWSDGSSRGC